MFVFLCNFHNLYHWFIIHYNLIYRNNLLNNSDSNYNYHCDDIVLAQCEPNYTFYPAEVIQIIRAKGGELWVKVKWCDPSQQWPEEDAISKLKICYVLPFTDENVDICCQCYYPLARDANYYKECLEDAKSIEYY